MRVWEGARECGTIRGNGKGRRGGGREDRGT